MNLAYGQGGLKLEINIPPQHILAKSKGGLIIEGGVMSSEYGILFGGWILYKFAAVLSQVSHIVFSQMK